MRQQKELPPISVASTRVAEALKKYWVEERTGFDVTLDKKDPIWSEWWVGASAIHKACPRMFALAASQQGLAGDAKELLQAETLWLFDQGHAYHDLMQQKALASFPPGILLGRWKRQKRNPLAPSEIVEEYTRFENEVPDGVILERGWGPRPGPNEEIGDDGNGWKYDEPKLRIPRYRMVVKIDAIFDWSSEGADFGLEVVEIKTEKPEAKDDLNPMLGGRPRPYHVEQAHMGMWATGLLRARIIYIFKGEKSLATSMIEHIVERDESIIEEIKIRMEGCIDAVKRIDRVRDNQTELVCKGEPDDNAEVVPFADLPPEKENTVRAMMKAAAEEVPRLPECQMKSKGRPKWCDGRDLCFGVRKKKVK